MKDSNKGIYYSLDAPEIKISDFIRKLTADYTDLVDFFRFRQNFIYDDLLNPIRLSADIIRNNNNIAVFPFWHSIIFENC